MSFVAFLMMASLVSVSFPLCFRWFFFFLFLFLYLSFFLLPLHSTHTTFFFILFVSFAFHGGKIAANTIVAWGFPASYSGGPPLFIVICFLSETSLSVPSPHVTFRCLSPVVSGQASLSSVPMIVVCLPSPPSCVCVAYFNGESRSETRTWALEVSLFLVWLNSITNASSFPRLVNAPPALFCCSLLLSFFV
jgi:hypothetical protein